MDADDRQYEEQSRLSQFEPDPEAFGACPDPGSAVEGLDWLTWADAACEQAWADVEVLQITPRVPAL